SSRRRHTRFSRDWSSDVCSSDLNRVLTDHMSDLLFAPTESACRQLQNEGIAGSGVHLSGDVMMDAALFYRDRARCPDWFADLDRSEERRVGKECGVRWEAQEWRG